MSAVMDARARAKVQPVAEETIQGEYLQALRLIERLHRLLLDVIKDEFQRQGGSDLNSVQALLIYNIGESELTAGDLKRGGYYLGSNVSYNVKKMVENGYLENERSTHDRRSVRLRLSAKGLALYKSMAEMFSRHIGALGDSAIAEGDLKATIKQLQVLEQFWTRQLNIAVRRPAPIGATAAA